MSGPGLGAPASEIANSAPARRAGTGIRAAAGLTPGIAHPASDHLTDGQDNAKSPAAVGDRPGVYQRGR
jgi:hypothetical protein